MQPITQRLLYLNRAWAAATGITASSYLSTAPPSFMRDECPTKVWRSKTGWNFTAQNQSFEFTRGGVTYTATLSGNYATGALLAAALQTAMRAADSGNSYTVTHNTSTKKFTVAGTSTFELRPYGGTNKETAGWADLGFTVSADHTGTNTYTGSKACYHSREWVTFDLGAPGAVQAGVVLEHNFSLSGVFDPNVFDAAVFDVSDSTVARLQGHSSAFTGLAQSPEAEVALAGGAAKRVGFFTASKYLRYWRLLVNDVGNTDGFSEAKLWLGPYAQLSRNLQRGFNRQGRDYSSVEHADQGAQHRTARARAERVSGSWVGLTDADLSILRALERERGRGGPFVLALDPQNKPFTDTLYGALTEEIAIEFVSHLGFYNAQLAFEEVLG